jgi:hypothetical protein
VVRISAGAGNFSLRHRVQTGSGAHLSFSSLGTRGSFPGVKRPGRQAEHSPPSTAEVKNVCGVIPPLPQYAFMEWCSVKAQGRLYIYLSIRTLLDGVG